MTAPRLTFALGLAARHYAPLGWSIAKAWITKKLSGEEK